MGSADRHNPFDPEHLKAKRQRAKKHFHRLPRGAKEALTSLREALAKSAATDIERQELLAFVQEALAGEPEVLAMTHPDEADVEILLLKNDTEYFMRWSRFAAMGLRFMNGTRMPYDHWREHWLSKERVRRSTTVETYETLAEAPVWSPHKKWPQGAVYIMEEAWNDSYPRYKGRKPAVRSEILLRPFTIHSQRIAMDTVPVDFIERAVFLLDDFSPLGELSYDSRFYTFFEQLSDKCYEESVLTCIVYKHFVLPSSIGSLQRCEENRKYLRRVEFMLPDMIYIQGTTNNNHDNQELEKRVLSLCFFAKEVHLVICFNFALEFDVNYVKKFLQLNIPVHNVTLGYTRPEMECDSLIDQLLRNALARKSLRTVRVKYFKGSSWNFLDGMFGRAEFETLEWRESEDTFREYGWRYIVSQWTLGHISRSMFPYLHRVKRSAIEEADGSIVKINDFRLSSELIKKIKKQGAEFFMSRPIIKDEEVWGEKDRYDLPMRLKSEPFSDQDSTFPESFDDSKTVQIWTGVELSNTVICVKPDDFIPELYRPVESDCESEEEEEFKEEQNEDTSNGPQSVFFETLSLWKCAVCQTTIKGSWTTRRKHIAYHENMFMICPLQGCSNRYINTIGDISKHMLRVHSLSARSLTAAQQEDMRFQRKYLCVEAMKYELKYFPPKSLIGFSTSVGDLGVQCTRCGKKAVNMETRRDHVAKHLLLAIFCPFNGCTYSTQVGSLRSHIKQKHGTPMSQLKGQLRVKLEKEKKRMYDKVNKVMKKYFSEK
ncbi:hypothetical protein QR680_006971 [Steinernema hermaphroditum]|uniref:C2H2-type domain-containing protein n=1 Tax=Steinernema hermaphroditum TaxID=289476 RepID=A0AA39LXZ6_9BILA|nr:hypothetical protein QR680_006971 [Steinernema hermaphroditum]